MPESQALPASPGTAEGGPETGIGGGRVSAVAELQGAAEGVVVSDQVEFRGQWFRIAENFSAIAQMKFAHALSQGTGGNDPASLAAMYVFIRACIHRGSGGPGPGEPGHDPAAWDPGDFRRWEDLADETCADGDEIFDFVRRCMEAINARPTKRLSGSSSPGPSTSPRSRDGSSSRRVPEGLEDLISIDELARRR